jgi:hypothetical protein
MSEERKAMSKIKFPVRVAHHQDDTYDIVDASGEALFDLDASEEFAKTIADSMNAGNVWQPIESAPKDGTWVLVRMLGCDWVKGRYSYAHMQWIDSDEKPILVDEWFDLPTQPEPEQPDDDDEAVALLNSIFEMLRTAVIRMPEVEKWQQQTRDYLAKREKGGGDE